MVISSEFQMGQYGDGEHRKTHPALCDLLTGTRSSGIRIFIVDPNLLPVEVFLLLKIEFDLPPDSEVRPSGTSALERRTDGRFGVDPSVVLRPVGTEIIIDCPL